MTWPSGPGGAQEQRVAGHRRPILSSPQPHCPQSHLSLPLLPQTSSFQPIWWKAGRQGIGRGFIHSFIHSSIHPRCSPSSQLLVPRGCWDEIKPSGALDSKQKRLCGCNCRRCSAGQGWLVSSGSDASRVGRAVFLPGKQLSGA